MAILETLRQSGGLNALARQLGQPPAVTITAVNVLLPGLVQRFRLCSGGMPELLRLASGVVRFDVLVELPLFAIFCAVLVPPGGPNAPCGGAGCACSGAPANASSPAIRSSSRSARR